MTSAAEFLQPNFPIFCIIPSVLIETRGQRKTESNHVVHVFAGNCPTFGSQMVPGFSVKLQYFLFFQSNPQVIKCLLVLRVTRKSQNNRTAAKRLGCFCFLPLFVFPGAHVFRCPFLASFCILIYCTCTDLVSADILNSRGFGVDRTGLEFLTF